MEALLAKLNSIYPLSSQLSQHLSGILMQRDLEKGDFLLKNGQISRNIYFIEQGLLRCYYHKDYKEVCTWFMKEGDVIVSVESFFAQQASFESIQALEPCSVWYISHEDLQQIYRDFLEFNFIGRELTQLYYVRATQELRGIRMKSAKERYKWLIDSHPALANRVPGKYLASWLDITEFHFSRIKGDFRPL